MSAVMLSYATRILSLSGKGSAGYNIDTNGRFIGSGGVFVIPDYATSIGSYAFYGCNNLTSITIPDNVTQIGAYAFRGCTSLIDVTIPNKVKVIEDEMFYGCSNLAYLNVSNGVTNIQRSSFGNCSNLTTMVFQSTIPPVLNYSNAFNGTHADLKIYVPDTSVDAYKAANNWVAYADKILPLSQLPT